MKIFNLFFKSLLLFLILFQETVLSQNYFIKSYGGPDTEIPNHLKQLPDSGFVLIGNTRSYGVGNQSMLLIRTDKLGDTLWTRIGSHINGCSGNDVSLTAENDLIVAAAIWNGNLFSPLLKFNLQGDLIWAKDYIPFLGNYETIKVKDYNDYILWGGSGQLNFLLTDSSGTMLSSKKYGGSDTDIFGDFIILDSGIIVCGSINCTYPGYAFLMKVDTYGNVLWSMKYNKSVGYIVASNVLQTNDNGFALLGGIDSSMNDILLMKTDSIGNLLWAKRYGSYLADNPCKLFLLPDNGFLISGNSASFNNAVKNEIYLIRTDANGDTLWTKCIGDQQNTALLKDIIPTYDGGYAMLVQSDGWNSSGAADFDFSLIVLDSLLQSVCYDHNTTTTVSDVTLYYSSFYQPQYDSTAIDNNNMPTFLYGSNISEWCPQLTSLPYNNSLVHYDFSIFPNPAINKLTIVLELSGYFCFELFNLFGSKIKSVLFEGNSEEIDITSIENGIYFYKIVDMKGNKLKTDKLIISK